MVVRALCGTVLAMLISSGSAAVLISSSSSVGAPPGLNGDGLNAEYYNLTAVNNAGADAIIANNAPKFSFVSSLLDYPNGAANTVPDGTTVGTFLGVDDPGITDNIRGFVMLFSGFIEITSAFDSNPGGTIDVDFGLNSDDGSRLRIGGVTVIDNPGEHTFFLDADGVANFEAEGLYPFELLYYEVDVLGAGLEVSASIPGGPANGRLTGIVPTSVLYTTPEPSTAFLLVAGLAGLSMRARASHRST